jgi:hypothetical protein
MTRLPRSFVAALIGPALTVFACSSGSTTNDPGSSEHPDTAAKGGSPPSGKPTGDDAGKGGVGKKDAGAQPPQTPDDPPARNCLARCASTIAPACQQTADFCSDVCAKITEAQLLCLETNTECDKAIWLACFDDAGH